MISHAAAADYYGNSIPPKRAKSDGKNYENISICGFSLAITKKCIANTNSKYLLKY